MDQMVNRCHEVENTHWHMTSSVYSKRQLAPSFRFSGNIPIY